MKLINPVQNSRLLKYPYGQVYQSFGENIALYMKAIGSAGHNGVNIVGEQATPIIGTKGEVVEAKDNPKGYGKHIRIITPSDIGGDFYELVYGHLERLNVKIGQKIEDNHVIGYMGNTGFVISINTPYWGNAPVGKGVHLHFGVRECSTKDTGWQTTYSSGKKVYVKNYNNGLHGYINPLQFIEVDTSTVQAALGILTTIRKILLGMNWQLRK